MAESWLNMERVVQVLFPAFANTKLATQKMDFLAYFPLHTKLLSIRSVARRISMHPGVLQVIFYLYEQDLFFRFNHYLWLIQFKEKGTKYFFTLPLSITLTFKCQLFGLVIHFNSYVHKDKKSVPKCMQLWCVLYPNTP